MFVKKEFSEEELRERRMSLDASLKRAEEARKSILDQRANKLRNHSLKVTEIGSKIKSRTEKSFNDIIPVDHSEFLKIINVSDGLEKFQCLMQKPDSLFKASRLVSFIEEQCSKGSYETVKSRPKVFMSLALLARFPDEVMPNADADEQLILNRAKVFYDSICSFFASDQIYSVEAHKEISWSWIRTIHAFDEWMVKDKQVLFEKMKTDFLTWTKTIGALSSNDKSRSEWETHALKYQNEILKRIYEIFGKEYLNALLLELKILNESFSEAEMVIDKNEGDTDCYCKWVKKLPSQEILTENTQIDKSIFDKLKTTNIRILHELMIKESGLNFENILKMSGKSMEEISQTNRMNLSKLISILETESDPQYVSTVLQELFQYVCSSLYELAGDNDDYCQEIKLFDCSIDSNNWLEDSCEMIRWSLSVCRKCCAPVRDSNCQELEDSINEFEKADTHAKMIESFSNTISLLLDLLNLMRNDFCNFRLKYLTAQIDGKGIAEKYELDELQKTFSNSFDRTSMWLSKRKKENLKPIEILIDSFIDLFDVDQKEIPESDLPETFYLDSDRIARYKVELEMFLKKEAGLIYLKNHLRTSKKYREDKENILLKTIESAKFEKNDVILREIFTNAIKDLSEDDTSLLERNINRIFDRKSDDKVYFLLKNRELSAIRSILMSEQKIQTETLTGNICSLFRYNKACFSSIYDEIILKK